MLSSRRCCASTGDGRADHGKGNLQLLAEAFFAPQHLMKWPITASQPLMRGLDRLNVAQDDRHRCVDRRRAQLPVRPTRDRAASTSAALNIQRGRDHGLPSLQRRAHARIWGSRRLASFADITSDPRSRLALAAVYSSVDEVDAWVGGLAEDHVPGAVVGRTCWVVLRDQFERLRAGDRFWYRSYLPADLVRIVESRTLSVLLREHGGADAHGRPFQAGGSGRR